MTGAWKLTHVPLYANKEIQEGQSVKYLALHTMIKIKIVNILCDFLYEIHRPTGKLKRSNKHLSVCLCPETVIPTIKQNSKQCNTTLDISNDGREAAEAHTLGKILTSQNYFFSEYLFQPVCVCVPVLSCACTSVQVGKSPQDTDEPKMPSPRGGQVPPRGESQHRGWAPRRPRDPGTSAPRTRPNPQRSTQLMTARPGSLRSYPHMLPSQLWDNLLCWMLDLQHCHNYCGYQREHGIKYLKQFQRANSGLMWSSLSKSQTI